MNEIRVANVRLVELSATPAEDPGNHASPPQARADTGVYSELHPGPQGWPTASRPRRKAALYLELETTTGVVGRYGPVDRAAISPLAEWLGSALVGMPALAGNYIWDVLARSHRHSRHGHYKIAMSAVDNALWDLRGRIAGRPVWQLLGGGGRPKIPAYASTLGSFHDGDEVERTAAELLDEGYTAQKWFFADGPAQGVDGMERNVALVERTRSVVGERSALMFDAFMGWDVDYARRWCDRVEHLRPDWLEEPLAPAAVPALARLRASTRVPLAAGEHLYDVADVLPLLQRGLLSVLQVDPEWCGGVTELVRMCAVADAFGVPVIPHGHGIHAALHVVASQSPALCPRVEYLYHHKPARLGFELDPPAPHGGAFDLPNRPGFGIELDDHKIEQRTDLVTTS
ncbi:enolase C-terminal domain-like protein [Saccharomonospora sp. NPDC046836]|uniref:enolase C-terminal domain-like protein n=1 Tax=Saccharomonospora sp. NPDC046836 TaxID=3156921 RepID=UPI0033FF0182